MKRVAIAGAASLPCGHRWDASAGDLAIEVAGGLIDRAPVDSVVVAAPAAAAEGQAGVAALLCDRLGIAGSVSARLVEAADASGAAALHAAYAQVAAGLSRCVLVLGVAKVSDETERERARLLDTTLDAEAERSLGLSYGAVAGLLADSYLRERQSKRGVFAQVVAKNAFNAVTGGETFHRHAPSPQELRRDIPVAPPLVRSDFAPLFDGATAVLVTDADFARELCEAPVEVLSVRDACDLSVVFDRAEPLALSAVTRAGQAALDRAGIASARDLAFVELHNSCSIVEVLALEALGLCEAGGTGAKLAAGAGRLGAEQVFNPGGGQHGRGMAFGVGGVEQAREAFLQLGPGAEARQVEAATTAGARAMSISVAGLGTQAFATVYGRLP